MQTFGARLKRIRESRGLSQSQLADKTGINRRTIRNYEQNLREPKLSTIEWLCGALGLTASDLLGF